MRNRIIRFLAIFFILSFIVNVGLGLILKKMDDSNIYGIAGGTIHYYLRLNERPDLLVMGSSRSLHNLDPAILSNSGFNLSHDGMSLGFHAPLIQILNQHNALPKKFLLLNIEPEELDPGNEAVQRDVNFLKSYYYSNDSVRKEINALNRYEFLKFGFYSYLYNGRVPAILKNYLMTVKNPDRQDNGFDGISPSAEDSTITEYSLEKDLEKFSSDTMKTVDFSRSTACRYLTDVAEICRLHHVQLILFTSPMYGKESVSSIKVENFRSFLEKYKIPYYDFKSIPLPGLQSAKLWKDYKHFNTIGAALFSEDFRQILRRDGIFQPN